MTTLMDTLKASIEAQRNAEGAECSCEDVDCVHTAASRQADAAVEAARSRLAESDELRSWKLYEDGHHYNTIKAPGCAEALEAAKEGVDPRNYPGVSGDGLTITIWVRVRVKCEATGENDSAKVACDPVPPKCGDGNQDHDWQTPLRIVGGIAENPGVWGNGGGVRIHEACMNCGCAKITDTWAQDRESGEQGLTSVEFEPGRYSHALESAAE